MATNDPSSGIYVDGAPLIYFNRPRVRIPVSIWIKKLGLLDDDSAVFNIQYAEYQEGVDPRTASLEWKSFTKVMVNSQCEKDGDGYMVKLVGLDPDYFYRIREDAWAWTYYGPGQQQFVYGDDQSNPFVFSNTPKATVKEAESHKLNEFGTGGTE